MSGTSRIPGRATPSSTTKRSRSPRDFLVPAHAVEQSLPPVAAVGDGQPQAFEHGAVPVGDGVGEPADAAGQLGGEHHAYGHRGTMPPGVAFHEFDGVAQSVAVIEHFALARLP